MRDPGTDRFPKPTLTRFPTKLSHTSKATEDHHKRAPEMVEQTLPAGKTKCNTNGKRKMLGNQLQNVG